MEAIKVLIVDDQHLFAESLKFVLEGENKGKIEVVGIVGNGQEAIAFLADRKPQVVLMDIRMPVMDGVEATAIIHRKYPEIKVLILTTFDDDELAVQALSKGANGYILKDVGPKELCLSIEAAEKGAFFISPSIGVKLFEPRRSSAAEDSRERENAILHILSDSHALTRREAEIIYHAGKAQSNKEIADVLSISEKTVKNHLSSIFDKLKIHNRLQLINFVTALYQSKR